MRYHALLLSTLLLSRVGAQPVLVNGGFENDAGGTLEGWESICDQTYLVSNAAPDQGAWAALIRADNTQPCTMNRLYQLLPDVLDGDELTLSGWVRNNNGAPVTGAFLSLGKLSSGALVRMVDAGTTGYPWEFVNISWVVALAPGDTAAVILSPGELLPASSLTEAVFDGLSLTDGVGIHERVRPSLSIHQHGHMLYAASTSEHPILEAHLLDAQGRQIRILTGGASVIEVDLAQLGSGLYVLLVQGALGSASRTFIRE